MALSRNEIKAKLGDILAMVMNDGQVDVTTLEEGSELVFDLGLNSVGVLYIVIAIEEFFNIEFDNVGFGDFRTLGDVIDYIEKKI